MTWLLWVITILALMKKRWNGWSRHWLILPVISGSWITGDGYRKQCIILRQQMIFEHCAAFV